MAKILIYYGESNDSFGYKKVNFDFKKGQKIMLNTGKAAYVEATIELSDNAFILLKNCFSYIKKEKWTYAYKALQLAECGKRLQGEGWEEIATSIVDYRMKTLSDSIENILNRI